MIARDGSNTSLWQSVAPYQTLNDESLRNEFDVIIVGGGITGLSTGLLLQKSGKQCLIVEAHTLGFGTTGGTTAHLNTLLDTPYNQIIKNFDLPTARMVKQAAEEAIKLIESNIAEYNIDCEFQKTSAYLFSSDLQQQENLEDIFEACGQVGLDAVLTEEFPLNIPFVGAMKVAGQGKFHPILYLHGLAKAFEELGGNILLNTQVSNVEKTDGYVKVTTAQQTLMARDVVYATHIPPGVNLLHLRCAPWRSYAMAVKLDQPHYPDELIYDMHDPYHYYRSQKIDGVPYWIIGGKDHKTAQESNTEKCFIELLSHGRTHFYINHVEHQWSSQYYESADGLPYIGILPGNKENIYVATGFGGNGMTYSGVAAITMAAMILDGTPPFENVFDPGRVKPVAGFSDFLNHNTHVVKQFLKKLIPLENLVQIAELAPGEGRVIQYEGKKIALSKDINGKVYAVSPICTHLNCTVSWNLSEQSWDCPCHGARYGPDGKVLNGPASLDLEFIELKSLVENR